MSTVVVGDILNRIIKGDALHTLYTFPDEFVDCVMTSPPYWGLRDYKTEGQIWDVNEYCEHDFKTINNKLHSGRGDAQKSGKYSEQEPIPDTPYSHAFCSKCNAWKGSLGLEPMFQLYIKHLIKIFSQIKRILKPEGALWVNIGDTYQSTAPNTKNTTPNIGSKAGRDNYRYNSGLPAKSLCMIPSRFAIAMIDDGWILRNTCIWRKKNCMPSSAKDRFTVDFEYVYFFVKSQNYFFETQYEPYTEETVRHYLGKHSSSIATKDYSANNVQNPSSVKNRGVQEINRKLQNAMTMGWDGDPKTYHSWYFNERPKKSWTTHEFDDVQGFGQQSRGHKPLVIAHPDSIKFDNRKKGPKFGGNKAKGYGSSIYSGKEWSIQSYGRLKRSTWDINTKSFKYAHFATFPEKLVETPLKATCPEFICNKCNKPTKKVYDIIKLKTRPGENTGNGKSGKLDDPNAGLHNSDLSKYREKELKTPVGIHSCNCDAGFHSGIILDPFMGSGTVALSALKHGRRFIGIELNENYINIAKDRIKPLMEQTRISEY